MDRRRFLIQLGAGAATGAAALVWRSSDSGAAGGFWVRPPGALAEPEFQGACVRCGLCAGVCPRGCVKLQTPEHGAALVGLPYIDVRERACDLCMRCAAVCPSHALAPIPADRTEVARRVRMGTAVVDEGLCISFLGRLCGICRDACPFPGKAIKLGSWARPEVVAEACVGCGLCVEICPQQPTAIRIGPTVAARHRKVEAES